MSKTALPNLKTFPLLSLMQRAISARVAKRKLKKTKLERPEMSLTLPDRRSTIVYSKEPTEIAVAAIFYNEAQYIKEWIEFHLMVGVDRLFLYDNGSSDHFQSILKPYIDRTTNISSPMGYISGRLKCSTTCLCTRCLQLSSYGKLARFY